MCSVRRLLTCGIDAAVHVWELEAARVGYATWKLRLLPLGAVSAHQGGTSALLALPQLGLFASCGGVDGRLSLWGAAGAPDGLGGVRGEPPAKPPMRE